MKTVNLVIYNQFKQRDRNDRYPEIQVVTSRWWYLFRNHYQNKYYVDKTLYLRSVFAEDGSSVLLFTRPLRFGKTLLMDMFADFFRLNYLNPSDTTFQQKRFTDKEIMKDKAFVDKYMGQFPVIFISLKDIKGINYDIAKGGLINLVKELARTFSFLQKSEVLSEDEKLD